MALSNVERQRRWRAKRVSAEALRRALAAAWDAAGCPVGAAADGQLPDNDVVVSRAADDGRCQHRTTSGNRCRMAGAEYVRYRDPDGTLAEYLSCKRHAIDFVPMSS